MSPSTISELPSRGLRRDRGRDDAGGPRPDHPHHGRPLSPVPPPHPAALRLRPGRRPPPAGLARDPRDQPDAGAGARAGDDADLQALPRAGRALLGRPVEYRFDHAIYKPAFNGRATAWHQDEAYSSIPTLVTAHFWVPVQDVSVEMGCMQFIPGSHRERIRPHHRLERLRHAHALETDDVDTTRAVACPLRAGDVTVHFPRTLHYTGPNLTAVPRLAWSLEFGPRRRLPFRLVAKARLLCRTARARPAPLTRSRPQVAGVGRRRGPRWRRSAPAAPAASRARSWRSRSARAARSRSCRRGGRPSTASPARRRCRPTSAARRTCPRCAADTTWPRAPGSASDVIM